MRRHTQIKSLSILWVSKIPLSIVGDLARWSFGRAAFLWLGVKEYSFSYASRFFILLFIAILNVA